MARSLLQRVLRGLRPALWGPLRFAVDDGFLRSALLCQAVDRLGRPLPWLTYPAIAFLDSLNWQGKHILEWGSGHSTLWWAERAASVTAIESSPDWYETVRRRVQGRSGIDVHLARERETYVGLPRGRKFDLAVIDGEWRLACAEVALDVVEPTGGIVLDNADWPWHDPDRPGDRGSRAFPVLELLEQRGWRRIDFQGFAPAVARPHCTSLFVRAETRLFEGQRPPRMTPTAIPG